MQKRKTVLAVSKSILPGPRYEGEVETFTAEQVQAKIDEATGGLKAKVDQVLGEKKKLQDSFGEIQDSLKSFQDLGDPAEIKKVLNFFQTNEEARLLQEGKIDTVVQSRVERAMSAKDAEIAAAKAEVDKAIKRGEAFRQRVIDDSLRAAAMEAGVHKHAIDDVLLHGRTLFQLDDEANTIQKDGDAIVMGADGKTPFGPLEWLKGAEEKKPHWFPADSSGSQDPNRRPNGGDANVKTMKRSAFEALTPLERADTVKKGIKVID